jgi:HSP20 family molecular chaperone IbpA
MRNLDLNSLWRSTVGFDRLFDLIDESGRWTGEENHYPPYNIERTGEDHYQIALGLAGFTPEDVSVTAEQNVLALALRARPSVGICAGKTFIHLILRDSNDDAFQSLACRRDIDRRGTSAA